MTTHTITLATIDEDSDCRALNATEARELTDHLRSVLFAGYELISRALSNAPHRALGYENLNAYWTAELKESPPRATVVATLRTLADKFDAEVFA